MEDTSLTEIEEVLSSGIHQWVGSAEDRHDALQYSIDGLLTEGIHEFLFRARNFQDLPDESTPGVVNAITREKTRLMLVAD